MKFANEQQRDNYLRNKATVLIENALLRFALAASDVLDAMDIWESISGASFIDLSAGQQREKGR